VKERAMTINLPAGVQVKQVNRRGGISSGISVWNFDASGRALRDLDLDLSL